MEKYYHSMLSPFQSCDKPIVIDDGIIELVKQRRIEHLQWKMSKHLPCVLYIVSYCTRKKKK